MAIDRGNVPEIKHILDFQAAGTWDEEWIPQVANESWIIISQDLGRKGRSKGTPLPEMCLNYRITHVLLSPRVNSRKSFDKLLTILSVWREILGLNEAAQGSRLMIEPHGSALTDSTKGKLLNKTPDPEPPPKDHLF